MKKPCSVEDCNQEAGMSGKCSRHARIVPKRTARFGWDREPLQRPRFPGGLDSVRTHLVETLAESVGDDHANAVVDALDAYLAVDPADRVAPFQWFPPNHAAEKKEAIEQRDEAVARAE